MQDKQPLFRSSPGKHRSSFLSSDSKIALLMTGYLCSLTFATGILPTAPPL
jgi:hypothetical protein